MNPLYTIEEVAKHFGLEPDKVLRRCQNPVSPWPHRRPNQRKSSTWRFTEDDVTEIERRLARGLHDVDSWGRARRRAS